MLGNSKYSVQFINERLREATGQPLSDEPKVEIIAQGLGFASRIYRLVYPNGDSFVAKLPMTDHTAAAAASTHQGSEEEFKKRLEEIEAMFRSVHAREIDFYEIAKNIPGLQCLEAKIPLTFGGENISEGHEGFLLMEDLTRKNAAVVDFALGYNEAQLFSCIDALVQWHSTSLSTVDFPSKPPNRLLVPEVVQHSLRCFQQLLDRKFPWMDEKAVELFKKSLDVEHLIETYSSTTLSKVDAVLVHNDFWPNNILFNGDELAAVVDWQCYSTGVHTTDLAGLFSVAVTSEVREASLESALKRYFEGINARKHQFRRRFDASFEDLKASLRRSLDWGLLQMLMTWGFNPHKDKTLDGETEGPLTRRLRLLVAEMLK